MSRKKQGFIKSYFGYFARPVNIVKKMSDSAPKTLPFFREKKKELDSWAELARKRLKNPSKSNFELGKLFYKEKNYSNAVTRFKIAIFMQKNDAESHFWLAKSLIALGKFEKAKKALEKTASLGFKGEDFSYYYQIYVKQDFSVLPSHEIRKEYFNNFAEIMDGFYIEDFKYEGVNKIADLFSDHLGNKKINILEIGCGRGYLAGKIKEFNKKVSITGLDFSENMIEGAKYMEFSESKADTEIIDLTAEDGVKKSKKAYDYLIRSNLFKYKNEKKPYQGIVSRGTINFIDNLTEFVAKISSLLESGGQVIFYARKEIDEGDFKKQIEEYSFPFFCNYKIHSEEEILKAFKKEKFDLVTSQEFDLEKESKAIVFNFQKK